MMMQLNENTLKVLQNFASLNPNFIAREENVFNSISAAKTILGEATVDQTFPRRFGLYDLGEFLSIISILPDHNLEFHDKYVVISDNTGLNSCKYFYASEEILSFTDKTISIPDEVATCSINWATIQKLHRAASALGHDKVDFLPNENGFMLSVVDHNDPTSNSFDVIVPGTCESKDFRFTFQIANFKMMEGDYEVKISSKMISEWKKTTDEIKYTIALDKSSTYGG